MYKYNVLPIMENDTMVLQLLPALTLLFLPPTIWVVAIGMAISGFAFFCIYKTVSRFGDTPNE